MKYIKCNLDGTIIVEYSVPSKRRYTFTSTNNTIPIDETNTSAEGFVYRQDVPDLLSKKRLYKACCGGDDSNLDVFVEV